LRKVNKKIEKPAIKCWFFYVLYCHDTIYNKGTMIGIKTHTCTSCGKELIYENKVSWMNARTKLNKTGVLRCQPCAGREGRAASNKQVTGRPKGSKTCLEKRMSHSRPGSGSRLNNSLTFEQRMQGIARRNGYETYEEYRTSLDAWEAYKIDVWRITNQQPLHLLENYDKRGINGEDGAYTLDHIYSIRKGFNNNVPPDEIGTISNLQMLPWLDNIIKGWK